MNENLNIVDGFHNLNKNYLISIIVVYGGCILVATIFASVIIFISEYFNL